MESAKYIEQLLARIAELEGMLKDRDAQNALLKANLRDAEQARSAAEAASKNAEARAAAASNRAPPPPPPPPAPVVVDAMSEEVRAVSERLQP